MFRCTNNFAGKIFIIIGDIKQILAVSEDESTQAQFKNLIIGSQHWPRFTHFHFTENLRMVHGNHMTQEERENRANYIDMVTSIGLGLCNSTTVLTYDLPTFKTDHNFVCLQGLQHFQVEDISTKIEIDTALQFLYPDGYSAEITSTSLVLAVTNAQVDNWNLLIQEMNPNNAHILLHAYPNDI